MVMIKWQGLCHLSPAELNRTDIGFANITCALGLPGAESLDVPRQVEILNEIAALVRQETDKLIYLFHRQPGSYQNSEAYFRMMVLLTVLQRNLGVHCDPQFNQLSDYQFFSRPEMLFVHGVLQTRAGTCSSLPPMFAAVGRRLGYPLKLVTACQHVFLRWDSPTGEKFNIECTSSGLVCHPDVYYQHWPRRLSDEQVRRYGALQSLSPRKELAVFVGNRGHVWREHYQLWPAVQAYAQASELDPENWSWSQSLVAEMNRWERKIQTLMMRGFPPMTIQFPPREFPSIPVDLERAICHLIAREKLFGDPALQEKWWKPLRRDPATPPRDLPAHITVRFPQKSGDALDFVFANRLPDWYDRKNTQPA